jgi:hypothetical protein
MPDGSKPHDIEWNWLFSENSADELSWLISHSEEIARHCGAFATLFK